MNTQILADLRAARALIEDPAKWAQGDYWLTFEGNSAYDRESVCCMCALGAALCATGLTPDQEGENERQRLLYDALSAELPPRPANLRGWNVWFVNDFNDHPDTTHADVLALFDRAIAAQEAIIAKELASGE